MRFYLLIAVLSILSLIMMGLGCVQGETAVPEISLTPQSYEFGSIGFDPVSHDFVVQNVGNGMLEILTVNTNCGCTTAHIDKTEISPGDEAILTVTFDPGHHNSAGRFMREVSLTSNDPEHPVTMAVITMTVVEE